MSVNKNDAKKPFVTKSSDNFTSENHVTGVYTPICLHTVWPSMLTKCYILGESVVN